MYQGVIVPLVSPLDANGSICRKSVKRLIDSLRGRVDGLMPTLSSGEGWKLSEQQWRDMVTYTVEYAAGMPVLAGVQLPTTEEVIARGRLGAQLGVDAIVVTTPFGKGTSQQQIYEHYQRISASVDVPLFLYNEAGISGNETELETLIRVCKLPRIVGLKESSGSPEFTRKLVAARLGIPIFQGWENLLLESVGVEGYVMPLANLEPELCKNMLREPTQKLQAEINAVCEKHGLFAKDWYFGLKSELMRRGVLETTKVV